MRGRKSDWLWTLAGIIGVTVSAGVAIFVGIQATLNPINQSPWDRFWIFVYVGLFVGIGILCYLWRERWLIVLACIAILAFILISTLQAHTGYAFLMLAWILVVAFGMGDKIFDLLAPYLISHDLERFILSVSLGLGALALLVLGLGSVGLLYAWVSIVMLAILTGITLPNLVRFMHVLTTEWIPRIKSDWRSRDLRFPAIILGSLAVCFWGGLVWALAPSIQFDALVYHLGVPAIYVQHHGIVGVPEEFRSYWAHNAEMLYTLGLLLANQPLPALTHLAFGVLTAGLTFTLGQRISGARLGLVAALLFYSVPIVTWESGIAYIDLVVTLFTFAAFYATIAWWLEKRDAWLVLVGVFAGLAIGSKLNATLTLLPLVLFILIGLVYRYRVSRRLGICLFAAGFPAFLVCAPWFFRDWWWTGNPIFPFYNAIFKSPKWNFDNTFLNFGTFGMGHSLIDLMRLPFDLVAHSSAFAEAAPVGLVGGITLLALPWMYFKPSSKSQTTAILISLLVLVVAILWFSIGQYLRYLLPIFPLLCIMAALNIESLWESISPGPWHQRIATAGLVLALGYLASTRLVVTAGEWQIPERYPYTVALGLETPGAFLSRVLPVYDALQFLNRTGGGANRVLSVGNEFRLYTTSRIWGISGSQEAVTVASALPPGSSLANHLIQHKYNFVLVNQIQINANPQMYKLPMLDQNFLKQFTRLEYSNRSVSVYKLLPYAEVSQAPTENLLWNSDFEESTSGTLDGWFSYGTPVIDQTGKRSHSGQVAVMATASSGFFQRVQITPGVPYTLGNWTRANKQQQFARLQINWLNNNLEIVKVSIHVVSCGNDWQWHQMSVTAPQGATMAQVYASVHENSQVWFDDFKFVQGDMNHSP